MSGLFQDTCKTYDMVILDGPLDHVLKKLKVLFEL